jgi:hypothetical protein
MCVPPSLEGSYLKFQMMDKVHETSDSEYSFYVEEFYHPGYNAMYSIECRLTINLEDFHWL